ITLPATVNAVDFYVGPQDFTPFEIAVTDDGGSHFLSDGFEELSTPVFFGVTTTGSFTSFTITTFANPDMTTLDDVAVGQGMTQTPEAATFLLVGSGLFCMGYFRRRGAKRNSGPCGARSQLLGLRGRVDEPLGLIAQ